MKRIALFLLLAWSAGAAISPLPVVVNSTNLAVAYPTNLWTSNKTVIATAVLSTLTGTEGQVLTIVGGNKEFADASAGFDPDEDIAPTADVWDLTGLGSLLLPVASVTMCCSNAFVVTTNTSTLIAVQATNNPPHILAKYSESSPPAIIDFYDVANGDFWSEGIGQTAASTFPPLTGAAVSSGTLGAIDPTANNQSLWQISSASGANSGYGILSRATHMFLGGSEASTIIVRFPATNTVVARGGLLDVVTATEPTDGVYWEVANGYIYGKSASNSVRSTTTTSNLLDTTTYYRIRVAANSSASSVTFTLLNGSGTQLWTDSLSATLPITATRAFGVGIVAISTSTNAIAIANVDAIGFRNKRRLTR